MLCPTLRIEPEQQRKFSPREAFEVFDGQSWCDELYGVATLPNRTQSCCGAYWSYFEAGSGESGCLDHGWVDFYVPTGSLNYDTYYIPEVYDWFASIAKQIYPVARFEICSVGFQPDDQMNIIRWKLDEAMPNEGWREANTSDVKKQLEKKMPDRRWAGLLIANNNQLSWFPPTEHYQ
jgi:hypothetical protein